MVENIFLTEKRRKVLDGTDDLSDDSRAVEKSRIRKRAKMAIKELQEVARSEEIESHTVFEPDDLARLIDALMVPSDGLTPRWSYSGTPNEYREEYQYQIHLHSRLNHALDGYSKMLHQNHKPGTEPDTSWPGIEDSE